MLGERAECSVLAFLAKSLSSLNAGCEGRVFCVSFLKLNPRRSLNAG